MPAPQPYSGHERRTRDRSRGIVLRRRTKPPAELAIERRSNAQNGFDIAAALEMHLDECKTRRAMLTLLEGWLNEAKDAANSERDESYTQAVENAIEVMKSAPDPLTAIAVLQRASENGGRF